SSSPTNRRPKREQRLLANYAPQVGGKATEGGLKGRIGGVVEIALGVLAEQGGYAKRGRGLFSFNFQSPLLGVL
ncbi:MAG: hypothetical protein IJZ09_00005, partial [Tidjanibacter sp.]|nr:hypothetical protein [Tidjanibacter sp.]